MRRDTTNKNKKNEKKKKKKKKLKQKKKKKKRERRWRKERHDEGCVTRGCSCNVAAAAFSGTHRTIARLFDATLGLSSLANKRRRMNFVIAASTAVAVRQESLPLLVPAPRGRYTV